MSKPQESFDALVLTSHALSDICSSQLVPDRFRKPTCVTESIDELLVRYKHTQKSIGAFIACLDDHSAVYESQDTSISGVENLNKTENMRESLTLSFSTTARENHHLPPRMNSAEQHYPVKNSYSGGRKRRNTSMSTQEKEDRRRDQNREAQRRFREKHMRFSSHITYSGIFWPIGGQDKYV